ncbi:hypothetical protein V6Z12_D10G213300 [Gossypium hirsutum]
MSYTLTTKEIIGRSVNLLRDQLANWRPPIAFRDQQQKKRRKAVAARSAGVSKPSSTSISSTMSSTISSDTLCLAPLSYSGPLNISSAGNGTVQEVRKKRLSREKMH